MAIGHSYTSIQRRAMQNSLVLLNNKAAEIRQEMAFAMSTASEAYFSGEYQEESNALAHYGELKKELKEIEESILEYQEDLKI